MLIPTAANFPRAAAENSSDQTASWQAVVRLCRRICVWREQGRASEADALREGELASVVATLRPTEEVTDVEARVAAIFATEEERVANAAVMAELLAPLLSERVGSTSGGATPSLAFAAARPSSSLTPVKPRGAGDIADFIDEMIAQERVAPASSRRAS